MAYPSKNTDTPTFGSKNSSSFTLPSEHATTPTFGTKNSSSFSLQDQDLGYLLKEDGFYLLLETGDKIILEPTTAGYSYQSKH